MKINYPIKYATMPIIEQVGWSHGLHELEREYDVVCYIVSKCYLINDLTKYEEDGSTIKEYEVVFPYQPGEFDRWKRVFPTYNACGYCANSNKVDVLFDSYEEALKYTMGKNQKLCEKSWIYLPCTKDITDKIREKEEVFNTKLAEYKLLEEQISLNTNDMVIGNNRKLNNVVRCLNGNVKIMSCTIYDVLQLFDNEKFVVYSVSLEQYNNLIKLNSEGQNYDIKSVVLQVQGLLTHIEKNDVIKLATDVNVGAYYFKDNNIGYDDELAKVKKEDFENIDDDMLIFYTTETIKDLMNSYRLYPNIDLRELKENSVKKLKKTIVII